MTGNDLDPTIQGRVRRELLFRSLLAMGRTAPNPAVAAVLLARPDGFPFGLLFSGGTEVPGKRHAEIVCLDSWKATGLLSSNEKSSLYVSLEPCSKTGRTGPCTTRILQHREIDRVHISQVDPSLQGTGIQILERAGLQIESHGNDHDPGALFLKGWVDRIQGKGPRFHSKVALTVEGAMGHLSRRVQISGPESRYFSMLLRSRMDGVIVGPGTVRVDHPGLHLRSPEPVSIPGFSSPFIFPDPFSFDESHLCSTSAIPESGDPMVDGILHYAPTLLSQIRLDRAGEFQPLRIFILGRPFDGAELFFRKQREIAGITGKEPTFFLLRKTAGEWKDLPGPCYTVPEVHEEEFASEIRSLCGTLGLNEVMIEGGSRIFEGMRDGYRQGDRFYILQSKQVSIEELDGGVVNPPSYLRNAIPDYTVDLGHDMLKVIIQGKKHESA